MSISWFSTVMTSAPTVFAQLPEQYTKQTEAYSYCYSKKVNSFKIVFPLMCLFCNVYITY